MMVDRHVQLRITKLERDAHTDIKSFETFIDVMVSRLPAEICQMTLRELLAWQGDQEKENCNQVTSSVNDAMQPPATVRGVRTTKGTKRGTAASDDGYMTGGTSMGSAASRGTKGQLQVTTTRRETRSSTRESRAKLSEINQKITKPGKEHRSVLKADNFKTPAMPRPLANMYDIVTPKIKPNTPLNVLRRPRQGEMVLSMQGSPLLVSAVVEEKTANINVPLGNGNVMSLLPQEGLRMSNIPPLDPETMHQLATLKSHIEKVMKSDIKVTRKK